MVSDEITDGERIGRLLSSEVHGHERDGLGHLSVADAETDVDPDEAGAFAYAVTFEAGEVERRIAEVYLHPERARVEFLDGVETAAETADREGIRARPKAVEPPRTLLFVENGAEVKDALRVVRAVAADLLEDAGES